MSGLTREQIRDLQIRLNAHMTCEACECFQPIHQFAIGGTVCRPCLDGAPAEPTLADVLAAHPRRRGAAA